jgi:hypothetical protein
VNECSSKRETSLFSSPIITTYHSREISPLVQPQSENKLFSFFIFAIFLSSFVMVLLGFGGGGGASIMPR